MALKQKMEMSREVQLVFTHTQFKRLARKMLTIYQPVPSRATRIASVFSLKFGLDLNELQSRTPRRPLGLSVPCNCYGDYPDQHEP